MIGWPGPLGPERKQFILAAAFGETVLLTGEPESGTEVGGGERERERERAHPGLVEDLPLVPILYRTRRARGKATIYRLLGTSRPNCYSWSRLT